MVRCHVSTKSVMNVEPRVRELRYDVREPDFGGNEYRWGCASRGQVLELCKAQRYSVVVAVEWWFYEIMS